MHILIVEDLPIFLEYVFRPLVVRAYPDASVEVVESERSLRQLLGSGRRFDLVLLGLLVAGTRRAPDLALLAAACQTLGDCVVVHATDAEPSIVGFMKQAGAFAYLQVNRSMEEFDAAFSLVLNGNRLFPPHDSPPIHLTPRQLQVLALLSKGASDKNIANRLGVSVHTVVKHMKLLRGAFHVANRTALVLEFRVLYPGLSPDLEEAAFRRSNSSAFVASRPPIPASWEMHR